MSHNDRGAPTLLVQTTPSRRATLGGGLAALAFLSVGRASAQEGTPAGAGSAKTLLLVQSFSHGTLFPTQGSETDLPPYTLILWDAADAGLFFVDRASNAVGIVPTERVLDAIAPSPDGPTAALVARPDASASVDQGEAVWALQLVLGSAGSEPGAVTYQGDVLDDPTASTQFGVEPSTPPDGPRNFGPGYLILPAPPGLDTAGDDVIRLTIT